MKTTVPTAEALLFGPSLDNETQKALIQPGKDGERELTYTQFYSRVDGFEEYFRGRGLKKGDRVILLSPNTIELAAAIFGAWRVGMLAVPVDFRMTAPEAANVTKSIEASTLLVSKHFADVDKLKELLGDNQDKLVSLEDCTSESGGTGSKPGSLDLDFDALMILTSGTTGVPKGAVHTMDSLVENLKELGELASLAPDVVALLPLPVSHIFGLEVLSACMMNGATIVFCELEPTKFIAAINKYKPQILSGVPLIYGALMSAPADSIDLSNARILLCGGAPLPISLAQEFDAKFHHRLNNGYGSTESKIIALNLDGPVESIGKPIPSVKIKIVNEQGELMPDGKEGEIIIDSPHLMKGYLGQPEKSKEVLTAEGYKTGDIGYVKDEYIYISGRAKEMIVVAGNKVFPPEVEEVLSRNPLVKEVAVTGPEHKKLGQIVKATIVIADKDLSEKLAGADEEKKAAREEVLKNLKQFCQENLKRELRPMEWDLRPLSEPLPKTRSGKIDKKVL